MGTMLNFKEYIDLPTLAEGIDLTNLDHEFLKRAQKITAFNLSTKDFESLEHKKEIQFLFNTHFFPNFNLDKTITGVDMNRLNSLIDELRSQSPAAFKKLYSYPLKGVGPGEALLYFLIDDAHLGGGSSAGVDLVVGSNKYEIKAVSQSSDGYAFNFKLGATFSLAPVINALQKLKVEIGGRGSEVNKGDLDKIRKQFPKELSDIENEYQELAYNNYFKNHDIIFMLNTGPKGKIGNVIGVKRVGRGDIQLERVTSGTVKPRVKL